MFLGLHPGARAERSSLRDVTAAAPLVLVSGGGVVASLVVWATRGWVDALFVYAATIVALGLMLAWLSRQRRHQSANRAADLREPSTGVAATGVAVRAAVNTGLSLAKSPAETESGLRGIGG